MQHMILINPPKRRRSSRMAVSRRRRISITSGAFGSRLSPRKTKPTKHMARSARRTRRARVRRNPPKMTPARRALISRKIKALHRSGKYRKSRTSSASRPARTRRRSSASRALVVRRSSVSVSRPARRASRRRRSSGGVMSRVGGGTLGLRSLINRDNLVMAGGALGGTFLTNYVAAKVVPMLPASVNRNPFVIAAIKLGTGAVAAKLASRYSRPAAQGILIGAMLVVANDAMQQWLTPRGPASAGTSMYLGGGSPRRRSGMAQYLGANPSFAPAPGRNVRSLLPPASPTNNTFAQPRSRGTGNIYGNTSAFRSDAWGRR